MISSLMVSGGFKSSTINRSMDEYLQTARCMISAALNRSMLLLACFSLSFEAMAKRGPAPMVPPVISPLGIEIRVADTIGDVAAIEARDRNSHIHLWTRKVYRTPVDHSMEEDVQWVFISKLTLYNSGTSVRVTSEAGDEFAVDLTAKPSDEAELPISARHTTDVRSLAPFPKGLGLATAVIIPVYMMYRIFRQRRARAS